MIKQYIPETGIRLYRSLRDTFMAGVHRLDWHSQRFTIPLKFFLKKYFPHFIHSVTSLSETKKYGYTEICALAVKDDSIFNTFKRDPDYRRVLEHVTEEDGQDYLGIIKEEGKDLLKCFAKFKENDKYGSPITFTYDIGQFSPTTLRYIKVLVDLKNIFGDLDGLDIIEIGGGYGGQCKIISDVFNYGSYTIVDLDTVLPFIQKYLTKLNVKNINYLPPAKISDNRIYDLLISNYAFSECVKVIQDEYIKKILNKSKRGYITYNYDKNENTDHPAVPYNRKQITQVLSRNHRLRILDERPQTGFANFIIIWDDTH